MQVGAYGDIVFEVSTEKVLTFKELQKKTSGRWAAHEVIGAKPKSEFLGPALDEITLPIQLNILLLDGSTIEDVLAVLENIVDKGLVSTLVIGEEVMGKYALTDMDQTRTHFGRGGVATVADVSLSLREYIERSAT